ncbi:MAG TPA: glycosyl transferase, partial [Candidatus Dormibacteraeota bacterium]|nr:glycosyl transferase [Candidatus Dormibacteraeota bacterium]
MRVVHISTYDIDGGAARAAFRLHESLLAAGQQSSMLVRVKHSGDNTVHQAPRTRSPGVILGELVQKQYFDANRTNISTTWFSLGWPG